MTAFKKMTQGLLRLLEISGTTGLALLILERFNQEGTQRAWEWFWHRPLLSLANWIMLLGLYLLIRGWFRKPLLPATFFHVIVYFVGLAHFLKVQLKGEPLLPMDVFNFREATMIAPEMNIQFQRGFLVSLLMIAFWLLLIWLVQRRVWQPFNRFRLLFGGVSLVIGVCLLTGLSQSSWQRQSQMMDIRYNLSQHYRYNGFVAGTFLNLSTAKVQPPEGYAQQAIQPLLQWNDPLLAQGTDEKTKPHLIVLQMEAYADPRLWDEGLTFKPDPFKGIETYDEQMQRFQMLVSVLGGSTATTEFEFLTGFNMAHAPQGIMPFVQYMNKARPSLAWDLRNMGYQTVGMHPNTGRFYSRNNAYPQLGFEIFKDIESFEEPEYFGPFVSDESFVDQVIKDYESRDVQRPLFYFGVSIQNHGPYQHAALMKMYDVEPGAANLSPLQVQELRNYAGNLQEGTQALLRLLDYFRKEEEPVIVVVFGDHHANWTWESQLPQTLELIAAKYTTEAFIWSNYPLEPIDRGLLHASHLSSALLKWAGLPMNAYYQSLYRQSQTMLAYNPFIYIDDKGRVLPQPQDDLSMLALPAYDRVFGENHMEALTEPQ